MISGSKAREKGTSKPLIPGSLIPFTIPRFLDVAAALAEITVGAPVNGMVEVAGSEKFRLDELVQRFLSANNDGRKVVTDIHARYFGIELNDRSLNPSSDNPRIGATNFDQWLDLQAKAA